MDANQHVNNVKYIGWILEVRIGWQNKLQEMAKQIIYVAKFSVLYLLYTLEMINSTYKN